MDRGRAARCLLGSRLMRRRSLLGPLAALLLAGLALATGEPGSRPPSTAGDRRAAAAAELATLARRIEALKRRAARGRSAGVELERLLSRAQELAALLERLDAEKRPGHPAATTPDPRELRERADALRDRADRLAASLSEIDGRLAEAGRRRELEERLEQLSGPGDLFVESATRGGAAGRAASSSITGDAGGQPTQTSAPAPTGAGAPTTTVGSTPSGGAGGSATVGSTTPASASGSTTAAAAAQGSSGTLLVPEPARAGGHEPEALATVAGMRRRRDEIAQQLAALRAEADALELQARAEEAHR